MGFKRVLGLMMVLVASSVGTFAHPVSAAAQVRIECGFFEYAAPDASTPGSIEFGGSVLLGLSGEFHVIAAGSVVPDNLGSLVGAPTCLKVTFDGETITELAYSPTGTVTGRVSVHGDPESDPANSAYVTAGRVMSPAFAVQADPLLWVILANAVSTGRKVSLTFNVHPEFGYPLSFIGTTSWRGPVETSDTDVVVGLGTLPEEAIDPDSRAALEQADSLDAKVHVTVTSHGNIDLGTGAVDVTSELDVTVVDDPVSGSIEGPCGGPTYYGVFDNSHGVDPVRFRMTWRTGGATRIATRWVPAGAVFRTWKHWSKPGTFVRLAYRNADTGRWVALDAERAAPGAGVCAYAPGLTFPI
jgi:hypothetical protein